MKSKYEVDCGRMVISGEQDEVAIFQIEYRCLMKILHDVFQVMKST